VTSKDYRLSISDADLKKHDDFVKVPTPEIVFFADQLECSLSLLFYLNSTPIPSVVKDFLISEEFVSADPSYTIQQGLQRQNSVYLVKCQTTGDVARLNSSVGSAESFSMADELQGSRLLVGRYCLYDNDKLGQVLMYNSDDTVYLRSVQTHLNLLEKTHISELKLIEQHGVSVYDFKEMPEQIKRSNFAWACKIVTTDKRLLNTIQRAIQDA